MIIIGLCLLASTIFGVSGACAVDEAKERFDRAAVKYQRLVTQSESVRINLKARLANIGVQIGFAVKSLKTANRILHPLQEEAPAVRLRHSADGGGAALCVLQKSALIVSSHSAITTVGVGLGAGSALAVGSWAAVSMLGVASTGTAIAGLHGIAATNAIWALFGHGALAAGGAGIVGGHVAMFGIVLVPAAIVMGVMAHSKANDINEKTAEIESANATNAVALKDMESQSPNIERLLPKVTYEVSMLDIAVRGAQSVLFKYGVFSRLRKYLRHKFTGSYYNANDMLSVDRLACAVDHFVDTFGGNAAAVERRLFPAPTQTRDV